MCGVFGFVSYDGKGPNLDRLRKVASVTMRRGPHAFGFAWVGFDGRLRMFKQTGRVTDYLGLLAMAENARLLIGHCRWATHGDPANNLNNHPHPADGGWIVHNGVIPGHRRIAEKHDLYPVTDCDSEVLGLLIETGEGDLTERCSQAASAAAGNPFAMLGVWKNPGRLVAVRSGNPLSVGVVADGKRYYLGSLADGLPGEVVGVKDGSGMEFGPRAVKGFDL